MNEVELSWNIGGWRAEVLLTIYHAWNQSEIHTKAITNQSWVSPWIVKSKGCVRSPALIYP